MVNYVEVPDLGALPHPRGKAPTPGRFAPYENPTCNFFHAIDVYSTFRHVCV